MDIDLTILFQLGFFLVLLVSLNKILLGPMVKVFEAREQQTVGKQAEVERLDRLGKENQDAYRLRIRDAQSTADKTREALINEGRAEERRIVQEARDALTDVLNRERGKVGENENAVRGELSGQTEALAKLMVRKVVGREVSA